jgi:hypothetical protein
MNAIPNSWIKTSCLALVWFCFLLACSGCAMYFPKNEEEHDEAMSEHVPPPQFATPGPYIIQPGNYGTWKP